MIANQAGDERNGGGSEHPWDRFRHMDFTVRSAVASVFCRTYQLAHCPPLSAHIRYLRSRRGSYRREKGAEFHSGSRT